MLMQILLGWTARMGPITKPITQSQLCSYLLSLSQPQENTAPQANGRAKLEGSALVGWAWIGGQRLQVGTATNGEKHGPKRGAGSAIHGSLNPALFVLQQQIQASHHCYRFRRTWRQVPQHPGISTRSSLMLRFGCSRPFEPSQEQGLSRVPGSHQWPNSCMWSSRGW